MLNSDAANPRMIQIGMSMMAVLVEKGGSQPVLGLKWESGEFGHVTDEFGVFAFHELW